MPREQLELINDIRDFITYFSLIGQKDLRTSYVRALRDSFKPGLDEV